MSKPVVKHLSEANPVPCPCGSARRILTDQDNDLLSVHLVHVYERAKPHYHTRLTETYYVLEGSGFVELDGERYPVRPGSVVQIPPGVVHRAIGRMRLLNIVVPPFDPADEYLAEEPIESP